MIITHNGNIVNFGGSLINFTQSQIENTTNYFIYVSGELENEQSVWKYDQDENLISSLSSIRRISGLEVDSEDNVIMVGDGNTNDQSQPNFYKYDFNGNLLFAFKMFLNFPRKVKVDSNNNIIVCGNLTNVTTPPTKSVSLTKFDSNGNLIWENATHNSAITYLVIDSNDDIFIGGNRVTSITTRKFNSSGTLVWSRDHGNTVLGVAVDSQNNFLTVGNRPTQTFANANDGGVIVSTRKYNGSTGDLLFSLDHGATVWKVAVDSKDNFITIGSRINDIGIRKYNSSGNLIWSIDYPVDIGGATPHSITIDNDDNIFVTVGIPTLGWLFKFNSDGEHLFTIIRDVGLYDIALANK
jgi:hypothetical protein